MSNILRIRFPKDFDEKYLSYKAKILSSTKNGSNNTVKKNTGDDLISIKLKNGLLTINKNTGDIKLNNVEKNINPSGQDFKALLKLATCKNHRATYKDLIGENPTKSSKRNLTFVLRNLKESLGILPKNQSKNKDIISNIKSHGYRLIT